MSGQCARTLTGSRLGGESIGDGPRLSSRYVLVSHRRGRCQVARSFHQFRQGVANTACRRRVEWGHCAGVVLPQIRPSSTAFPASYWRSAPVWSARGDFVCI